jgi:hypothetical protein
VPAEVQPLSGSELVLIAQVPKAGPRWHQVHFNVDIGERLFRQPRGDKSKVLYFERIDSIGQSYGSAPRSVVFSERNRNYRIEFDFGDVRDYPVEGVPLLVVLELDVRRYRYVLLLPGDRGYREMMQVNMSSPPLGAGLRRVVTTLDEIELRWPDCPLRMPRPAS